MTPRNAVLFVLIAAAGCATSGGGKVLLRKSLVGPDADAFARSVRTIKVRTFDTNENDEYYTDGLSTMKRELEGKGYRVEPIWDDLSGLRELRQVINPDGDTFHMAQVLKHDRHLDASTALLIFPIATEAKTREYTSEVTVSEESGHIEDSSGRRIATAYTPVTYTEKGTRTQYISSGSAQLFHGGRESIYFKFAELKGQDFSELVRIALSGIPARAGGGEQ